MNLLTRLEHHVRNLCTHSERTPGSPGQRDAVAYIEDALKRLDLHVERQPYATFDGHDVCNIEARVSADVPRDRPVLVLGAHHDTVDGTPGADDNASAVALLIEVARELVDGGHAADVLFASYACEEPPYFKSPDMGSMHHAALCVGRGLRAEMICLESLGYFKDEPGSQQRLLASLIGRPGNIPSRGNFVGIEANAVSACLLKRFTGAARADGEVPFIGMALPDELCLGPSDHASYWWHGFPAIMLTDTAMFRNPHYHRRTDTPDTLDYPTMATLVGQIVRGVVASLPGRRGLA